ncbi:MAG: DinB family protein [Gemmatimonadales bacterium]
MAEQSTPSAVIESDQLLQQWQGHRKLTRRVIDAFPEKDLFEYQIGGMRTFAQLASEFLSMGVPTLVGVTSRKWPESDSSGKATTKAELLQKWDESTAEIDRLWKEIAPERFQEEDTAFGQWKMPIYMLLLYVIDNEVHHRGQGYVYLRSLGIEPPPFYER